MDWQAGQIDALIVDFQARIIEHWAVLAAGKQEGEARDRLILEERLRTFPCARRPPLRNLTKHHALAFVYGRSGIWASVALVASLRRTLPDH